MNLIDLRNKLNHAEAMQRRLLRDDPNPNRHRDFESKSSGEMVADLGIDIHAMLALTNAAIEKGITLPQILTAMKKDRKAGIVYDQDIVIQQEA